MKKTSVLFVMGYMQVGGIEKSLIRLCKALDQNKYEITALFLSVGEGISTELPDYVTRLFVSRKKTRSFDKQYKCLVSYDNLVDRRYNKPCGKIKKRIYYHELRIETAFFKKYIKGLFCNKQFDVSVGFMQGEPSDVAMSCINAKKRIVFYRHGTILEFLNDKDYYSKADTVIALSEGVKNDLIAKRGVPENKIKIIHNVYDIDNIIEKSKAHCVYDSEKRIKLVTVARISPEKGILQAIKAAKLLRDNNIDFLWLFVGKNEGDYYEECKQAVLKNNLADNIVFTGVQSNPYPYIRTTDVYVSPSECESLGNTIAEALIIGRPIVSTKTSGAQELIKDKENGIICGFESKDISKSIVELLCNKELEKKIIYGAKNSVSYLDDEINKYNELFSL